MSNIIKRKIIFVLISTAILWGVFSFGYESGKNDAIEKYTPPEGIDFSSFWEAYNILLANFVGEINKQDIIYGAITGMTNALGDPHTNFFTPNETKRFLQDAEGRFEGVGMEVDIKDGQFQVVAPLKGTPADQAGLMPGDRILKIDDKKTDNLSLDEAVNLIRGPRGTEVVLTVFRSNWNEPKEITITRATIEVPSLEWELLEGDIAHIKFYHFYRNSDSAFRKMALEVINSPAKGIILDLRNNTGGYLEISQIIGGWFLEKNQVFVIEDDGQTQKEYTVKGNGGLLQYPLVILINKGSASASEILAGALRDHRGVLLIGETSFGKGSIQTIKPLRDGSSLKITIANWLTPKGYTISEKGLKPDYEIGLTIEDYEAGLDPQLEKAIEVIKRMI